MKFGKLTEGKYHERYEKDQAWFYKTMIDQLRRLSPGSTVLDIGSGPGTLAKFSNEESLSLKILGVEPSDLMKDGINLSIKLIEEKSSVQYVPKKGSVEDAISLFDLKKNSVDAIVLMRSAHEIAKSIGYENFKIELEKLSRYLKKEGLFIIGDPTYRIDIVKNKSGIYDKEVEIAKALNEEFICHSHPVNELIPSKEIIDLLSKFGCGDVLYYESKPNTILLERARKNNINLERSPLNMYVLAVKKVT